MQLSDSVKEYINGTWGLGYSDQCDGTVALWSCGYYEEATKCLLDAGTFSFEPGDTPEYVKREILQLDKSVSYNDIKDAIRQCIDDGSYKIFECPACECIHFINCLYFDGAEKEWECDSCAEIGPFIDIADKTNKGKTK